MAVFSSSDFTGTDGANVTTLGWTAHPSSSGDLLISAGGRAYCGSVSGALLYLAPGTPSGADYTVAAKVRDRGDTPQNGMGVAGRLDATANTCYIAIYNTDGTKWQLFSIVAGAYSLMNISVQALTADTDYLVELVMAGDQISVKVDGSTVIGPITNTAVTAAGRAGVWAYANTARSSTTGLHLDDFAATDPSASGSPVKSMYYSRMRART
jgi:hypothetical protein